MSAGCTSTVLTNSVRKTIAVINIWNNTHLHEDTYILQVLTLKGHDMLRSRHPHKDTFTLNHAIFRLTEKEGIIYVADPERLRSSTTSSVILHISRCGNSSVTSPMPRCTILVIINITLETQTDVHGKQCGMRNNTVIILVWLIITLSYLGWLIVILLVACGHNTWFSSIGGLDPSHMTCEWLGL